MKKIIMVTVTMLLVMCVCRSYADTVYIKQYYFNWDEGKWPNSDKTFVKEAGLVHAVGVDKKYQFDSVFIQPSIEVFGGSLNYRGCRTQKFSVWYNYETKSYLFGATAEVRIGTGINLGKVVVTPFGVLGYSKFLREIAGEIWDVKYGKAGIRAQKEFGKTAVYVEAGLRAPISTVVEATWKNYQDVGDKFGFTMRPKNIRTWFMEIGTRKKGCLSASIFYELKKYGESDPVGIPPYEKTDLAMQPRVENVTIGHKIEFSF